MYKLKITVSIQYYENMFVYGNNGGTVDTCAVK